MRTAERSVTLPHPPAAVFAFVADIGNLPRWQSGVVRAEQTSPGPVGVGTTAVVERRLMGQDVRADLRVTRFEPDRAIVLETEASGVHVEASIRLEQMDGEGCRVTFGMTIDATNVFMRPLEAMVAQAAEGDIGASLEALQRTFG
jgi:uncharacterized protein YndB with AHSA1/START domain